MSKFEEFVDNFFGAIQRAETIVEMISCADHVALHSKFANPDWFLPPDPEIPVVIHDENYRRSPLDIAQHHRTEPLFRINEAFESPSVPALFPTIHDFMLNQYGVDVEVLRKAAAESKDAPTIEFIDHLFEPQNGVKSALSLLCLSYLAESIQQEHFRYSPEGVAKYDTQRMLDLFFDFYTFDYDYDKKSPEPVQRNTVTDIFSAKNSSKSIQTTLSSFFAYAGSIFDRLSTQSAVSEYFASDRDIRAYESEFLNGETGQIFRPIILDMMEKKRIKMRTEYQEEQRKKAVRGGAKIVRFDPN